jgi:hypothetical protein
MFDKIKGLFERGPLDKLQKMSSEKLQRKLQELDHEIKGSLAEGRIKQQEIENQLLKGADAADWELDVIAENCSMLQDELKSTRDDIIALQKVKSVVHVLHILKKSKITVVKETREGLQSMLGAKTADDITVALSTVRQSLNMEVSDISQVADDLKTEIAAPNISISNRAQSFKEQITAMKKVDNKETREQMAKDKAKEMLAE